MEAEIIYPDFTTKILELPNGRGIIKMETTIRKKFYGKWYKFKVVKSFQYSPLFAERERQRFMNGMCTLQKEFNSLAYDALLFSTKTELEDIYGNRVMEEDMNQQNEIDRRKALLLL